MIVNTLIGPAILKIARFGQKHIKLFEGPQETTKQPKNRL